MNHLAEIENFAELKSAVRAQIEQDCSSGVPTRDGVKRLSPGLKSALNKGVAGQSVILGWRGRQFTEALETLFHTYLHSIYAAGRYRRQKANTDHRPWWRYVAILDGAARAGHRALHGKIFRHDDAVWDVIYPLNGLRCRCRVIAMTESAAANKVIENTRIETINQCAGGDRAGNTLFWQGKRVCWVDTDGKEYYSEPAPGWAFNPGVTPIDFDWLFDQVFWWFEGAELQFSPPRGGALELTE